MVLPGPGPHTGLALSGSFFLGPDLGWGVHEYLRDGGPQGPRQITTVFGTTDGGQHWWRTAPLPDSGTDCCNFELDFTDAQHGWMYGMAWTVQGDMVWQTVQRLWRTSDGGHTWTLVHARLPLKGVTDSDDEICPDEGPFRVAFANQQDGWLTASTCSTIGIAPRVWRTTDGGQTWTAVLTDIRHRLWARWSAGLPYRRPHLDTAAARAWPAPVRALPVPELQHRVRDRSLRQAAMAHHERRELLDVAEGTARMPGSRAGASLPSPA